MLEVLDLYPYFSSKSQEMFWLRFKNDVIGLVNLEGVYCVVSVDEIPLGKIPLYYLGRFTNKKEQYKIYRQLIVIMGLLDLIKINKKYLTVDENKLKLAQNHYLFTDKFFKPITDKSNFSTTVITFDGNMFYLCEFCNFNKSLLSILYEDTDLNKIKYYYRKRALNKSMFANVFWKIYNENKKHPCLYSCLEYSVS